MTYESRSTRVASAKQELRSHQKCRKQGETDLDLPSEERKIKLAYDDTIIERLKKQIVVLEGQ